MQTDWRLNIGKISPSVFVHSSEYHKMLPEGMDMAVVTTEVEETDGDDLSNARAEARHAVKRLDARDVDCIIAGGAPIYATDGEQPSIDDRVTAPIATSLECHVDALKAVGAESILAVTPYTEERDADRKRSLEDAGLSVTAIGGKQASSVADIVDVHPQIYYRHSKELAAAVDGSFDAIYIPCAALKVVDYIKPLEQDLGCPVVTSAQSQVWKAFELGKVSPHVEGYGELFETL